MTPLGVRRSTQRTLAHRAAAQRLTADVAL